MGAIRWIEGRPPPSQRLAPVAFPREWLDLHLIDCFERVASGLPDKVVVDDGRVRYTFGELRRAAYRLAAVIQSVTPADRPVAVLAYNDAAFPVMQLALFAAGRSMVLVDAASPSDRQRVVFREAGVRAVLAAEDPEIDLSVIPPGVVRLPAAIDIGAGEIARPSLPANLDAVATITFTSGSTSQPKGVAFSLRHTLDFIARYINANAIGPNDVIAGMASLSAGGSRASLAAVLSGACIRFVDLKRSGVLESLRAMREEQATILGFLPSPLRSLMHVPGIETALAHLRVVDLGGEAITVADLALFRSKLPPDCRIGVALGSTDALLVCRWFVEDAKVTGAHTPSGYVDDDRTIAIVDEDGRSVGEGEPGELVVSDTTVSLGYWRAGALTDSFPAAPGDPGPRTCRTGDIVRMRPDGLVEFLGRRDRMVKVRGLRVDLGEVERALRTLSTVAEAVVVAAPRENDSLLLTAYVTTTDGASPIDPAVLRQVVADEAGEHMVPHAFRLVEAIPKLYNGKPDLVRLQALSSAPP